MRKTDRKYSCMPFWSWNDKLVPEELRKQIKWMDEHGVGGFFMHARGGLKTEYLGEDWFNCINVCLEEAEKRGMEGFAYDENGWPSGFAGGRLLEDIKNHDKYLTYSFGKYDEKSLVSYDMSGERIRRVTKGEVCLNLYENYSVSTVDILNPEIVDKFISITHEQYKNRGRKNLGGFFTDEPQYYRWGPPYTDMIRKYFSEVYKEDILDGLGLMFVKKEGYRSFRYKYWKAMQRLMIDNFAKKIYYWCDKNGYKFTGHYIEESSIGCQILCCGGIMPFYEYEHIPGIDWLGRRMHTELPQKQIGSVAAQLGKKQVISEMFACSGWDVTPQELRAIAEFQYVGGVNLMCQHLVPYSEHGQRKRDYPPHFSKINPWVDKAFGEFNGYFAVLGEILTNSRENVRVAMMHPVRSGYFDYNRELIDEGFGITELDEDLAKAVSLLGESKIPFHFLDETLLEEHGDVRGAEIICGECAYSFLVLPTVYTMDKNTERLVKKYVANGGKILLLGEKPGYIEGEPYDYPYLESNITFETLKEKSVPFTVTGGKNVRMSYRTDENGREFLYLMNTGKKTSLTVKRNGFNSFNRYDILKDEYRSCGTEITLDEEESGIYYFDTETAVPEKEKEQIKLCGKFDVVASSPNYMPLDFLSYSTDGENYSEYLHHIGVRNILLDRRYKGHLWLKYRFYSEISAPEMHAIIENEDIKRVTVNGKETGGGRVSDLDIGMTEYDVGALIKKGVNEIVAEIDYYQSEHVYYVLYNKDVTESLKNCLAYDCDVEPLYLKGDFGVYGTFENGKNSQILLGDNFYIGEKRDGVEALIKDGYPFFSGDITLKKSITVDNANKELVFDKRFHLIDVKVNGKFAGRLMFGKKMDISEYLAPGRNDIEITLTVGNRNLMGPFHTQEQESNLCFDDFEKPGTWENGKSRILRESYALVKTII